MASSYCRQLPSRSLLGCAGVLTALDSVHGRNGGANGTPFADVRAPPTVRRLRGARTSRSASGFALGPGCGRGRPRTSHGSAAARYADLPVRIGLAPRRNADEDVRAPPSVRRRTSHGGCADLPVRIGVCARPECGRGRPRTSRGSAAVGARTSRSASGFAPGPECGRGRPRTSHGSAAVGARTSRSALGFAPRRECGRGRPRTSRGSAAARYADHPVRIGFAPRRDADGDVRAPPAVRRVRGARTSRSALGFAPRLGCGRGRPRTSYGSAAAGCADLPVRIGLRAKVWDADGDVRAPPAVQRLRGARTSWSALGFAPGPGCGRGRPRTSHGSAGAGSRTSRSASGFAPGPGCGRGRPRTSHGSAGAGCADLLVRIGVCAKVGMRAGTSAYRGAIEAAA